MSIWELRIVIMGTNLRFKSFANAVELFSINFQIRSNSFLNITSPKLVDIKDIFCRILPKERAPLNEVHDSFDHSLSSYIIKKVMKWHKTPAYYNIYFFCSKYHYKISQFWIQSCPMIPEFHRLFLSKLTVSKGLFKPMTFTVQSPLYL